MIILNILCVISSVLLFFVAREGLGQNENSTYESCIPFDPKMPDFSKPGRRLSNVKCFEYVWQIEVRLKKQFRNADCLCKRNRTCFGFGGRDSNDGEYPHMAAIGWKATNPDIKWHFKCCGSLISEQFVLTAGHCIQAVIDSEIADAIPKIVRVGNKNIAKKPSYSRTYKDIEIAKIIPHPNYKPPNKYNDIALMKLAEPIEFSFYIQPACLLSREAVSYFGPSVTATGWGITKPGGPPSNELQAVSLELLDSEFCDPLLMKSCNRHWCGLQDHQICAANLSGGVDTCSGDSGGPLQVKLMPFSPKYNEFAVMQGIIGVTSFGVKCALKDSPGVYTRVSYFLDWIEDIVWRSDYYDDYIRFIENDYN